MFFGAAAVLLVCGLLVLGCKDDGGSHPLNGTWTAAASGSGQAAVPERVLKLTSGGTKYEFSMTFGESAVLIKGNLGSLTEPAQGAAYTATSTISSLKLGGEELEGALLTGAGIADKAAVKIPLIFTVNESASPKTLTVVFGDISEGIPGITAGSAAATMMSVFQGSYTN
jgi:hypothetical protein